MRFFQIVNLISSTFNKEREDEKKKKKEKP
jgi:hypothetical protein